MSKQLSIALLAIGISLSAITFFDLRAPALFNRPTPTATTANFPPPTSACGIVVYPTTRAVTLESSDSD